MHKICTRLICYLWTQGGVKLTEKDAFYSTVHTHYRFWVQATLNPREFTKLINFNQTVSNFRWSGPVSVTAVI